MNKTMFLAGLILCFIVSQNLCLAQSVRIGPRITGNYTIYNEQGGGQSWNGIGAGIGGNVDLSFSQTIGMLVNLTVFDMRGFSSSITQQNTTNKFAYSLSYVTIDPMFKAEFSGFFMVAGPSLGVKLAGSGERTTTTTGQQPNITPLNAPFKSVRFDIAVGTGYNIKLSDTIYLGTDFMGYIPVTSTFDFPGLSNSTFSLKVGAALKFVI